MAEMATTMGSCVIALLASLFLLVDCDDTSLDDMQQPLPFYGYFLPRKPGRPGWPGAKGEKGDTGPPGVVNYTPIQNAMRTLREENCKLSERVRVLEVMATENCSVYYNGSCFHYVNDRAIKFPAAKQLCETLGWTLANIYSPTHYEMIANYLRKHLSQPPNTVTLWLGMTINPSTKVLSYSNGTEASDAGLPWYPGYPKSDPSYTKMGLHVDRRKEAENQGIHSFPTDLKRDGSLCEHHMF